MCPGLCTDVTFGMAESVCSSRSFSLHVVSASLFSLSDFLMLPGFVDFTADQVVSFVVLKHVSIVIGSEKTTLIAQLCKFFFFLELKI